MGIYKNAYLCGMHLLLKNFGDIILVDAFNIE